MMLLNWAGMLSIILKNLKLNIKIKSIRDFNNIIIKYDQTIARHIIFSILNRDGKFLSKLFRNFMGPLYLTQIISSSRMKSYTY